MKIVILLALLVVPIGSFLIWLWRRSKREPVFLLEPLDIGRVLGRTFAIFGKPRLIGLALLFLGVPRLVAGLLAVTGLLTRAVASVAPSAPGPSTQMLFGSIAALFYLLIGYGFTIPATLSLVGDFEGRPIELFEGLRQTPRLLLPMLGLFIMFMLGIMLGTAAFIWPGILLLLSWGTAFPALIQERIGVIGSLKRSHALSIGSRGRILLILILFYVMLAVLLVPMSFLELKLAPEALLVTPWLVVAQFVWAVLGGMIGCSLPAALYVGLREIRQGTAADGLAEVFA